MEKVVEFFSNVLDNHGIQSLIIVLLLFVIIGILFFFYKNPKLVRKFTERIEKRSLRVNRSKLKKHPLFEKRDEYLYRLKSIRFPGEHFKTVIIRLFISTKIEINTKIMYNFINYDNMKLSKMELKMTMHEAVDKVVHDFDNLIRLELKNVIEMYVAFHRKDYTDDDLNEFTEKLYEQVMFSEFGWVTKRNHRVKDVRKYIKNASINDIYNSNYERMKYLLDVMNFMIDNLITDSLETFAYFNGTIEKMFDCFIKACDEKK